MIVMPMPFLLPSSFRVQAGRQAGEARVQAGSERGGMQKEKAAACAFLPPPGMVSPPLSACFVFTQFSSKLWKEIQRKERKKIER